MSDQHQHQHEGQPGHQHLHGAHHHHDGGHSHLRQRFLRWLPVVALLAFACSGIRTIGPAERGVQQRFGKVINDHIRSGIHFGLPLGIDRLTRVATQKARRVGVGINVTDRLMGVLPDPAQSQFVSGDRNIVVIQLSVQYTVTEPPLFLFTTADPAGAVSRACEAALCEVVGKMPVDQILTVGKAEVQRRVRQLAQEMLKRYDVGVRIISVTQEKAAPPERVADAFRAVTNARADRARMIAEAKGYRDDLLPRARGEAVAIRQAAEGQAFETVALAEGKAAAFEKVLSQARLAPEMTRRRLHAETIEKVLRRTSNVLISPTNRAAVRMVRETP